MRRPSAALPRDRVRTLHPIRLVQVAPVVVLALMAFAWLLTPSALRGVSFEHASTVSFMAEAGAIAPVQDPTVTALQRLGARGEDASDPDVALGGIGRATRLVAEALGDVDATVFGADSPMLPEVLLADDPAFDPLLEHEELTGGETLAILLSVEATPPLAFAAIADETLLTPGERAGDPDAYAALRASDLDGGSGGPGVISTDGLTSGYGWPGEGRNINYGLRIVDGHFYEIFGITPLDGPPWMDIPMDFGSSGSMPGDAWQTLEQLADNADGCVLVLGPLDEAAVVLRAGSDRLIPVAQDLMRASAVDAQSGMGALNVVRTLPTDLAGQVGAEWFVASFKAAHRPQGWSGPPPVLWVVGVYHTSPEAAVLWENIGRTPLNLVRVWLGANLLLILGILGVCFAASLIAAPVAFVYESRAAEERDIERERERLRSEAEARVFERLARLSAEVEQVAGQTTGAASREASQVADDIDSTVAALRELLGGSGRGDDRA